MTGYVLTFLSGVLVGVAGMIGYALRHDGRMTSEYQTWERRNPHWWIGSPAMSRPLGERRNPFQDVADEVMRLAEAAKSEKRT